jgi:small subunit ribosomal protein S16
VVSDGRLAPTAKIVEELGSYDPTKNPPSLKFDRERAKQWISKGARASETVRRLIAKDL